MEVPTDSRLAKGARPEASSETASVCEPYRELIVVALRQRRNAMAIWQELVDTYGFAGRYDSVKRFVRKVRGWTTTGARVVIETAPGEEAQVDYGTSACMARSKCGSRSIGAGCRATTPSESSTRSAFGPVR